MKKKILSIKFLMIFVLATTLIVGCKDKKKDDSSKKEANLTALDIGYSRLRISLPVFVAKEKGFFEKNGINANLIMFETAQPLMKALVTGKVDIGGYTALPITYNGMLKSKKEMLFLTTMIEDDKHRISYFLKKKGDDQIKTIKDLRGKKVGILPTIAYKAWVEEILKKNGLEPNKDVIVQQVAPPQQPLTLKSGGVDALFTNDPAATSAIELGIATPLNDYVEVPRYVMNPFPFGSFNVSKEWADNNPEVFSSIKKSLNEAINWINENQEEAKLSMIPYLPEKFKDHVSKYPNAKYLRTDQSNDSTFNKVAKEYLKMGIIKQEIDLTGKITK